MLKRLHLRVFKVAVDSTFQSAFMDYYNERAEFDPDFMGLKEWRTMAEQKVGLCSIRYMICPITHTIGLRARPH